MLEKNKHELFEQVAKSCNRFGLERTTQVIQDAHTGRPTSFVTNDNLHLFRQYRNHVTNNAHALVYDAVKWATNYLYLPKEDEVELSKVRTQMSLKGSYESS